MLLNRLHVWSTHISNASVDFCEVHTEWSMKIISHQYLYVSIVDLVVRRDVIYLKTQNPVTIMYTQLKYPVMKYLDYLFVLNDVPSSAFIQEL